MKKHIRRFSLIAVLLAVALGIYQIFPAYSQENFEQTSEVETAVLEPSETQEEPPEEIQTETAETENVPEEPAAINNDTDPPDEEQTDSAQPAEETPPETNTTLTVSSPNTTAADADEEEQPETETAVQPFSIDPYITSGSVETTNAQGTWSQTNVLKSGEKFRITLKYTLPEGLLSRTNHVATYQLPEGLAPDKDSNGTITNNQGVAVGTYTISTSGKVVLTFDPDYAAKGGVYDGTLKVNGSASLGNDKTAKTVTVPGIKNSVTIEPNNDEPDIAASKTGAVTDGKTIQYTINVSSLNGTGGQTVSVYDQVNSAQGADVSYDSGSVKVMEVNADGQETEVTGYSASYVNGGVNQPGLYIPSLPALKAGCHYVITYDVNTKLNQTETDGVVENSVQATAGSLSANANATTQVPQPMVHKEGSYNPINQDVTWTITLNRSRQELTNPVLSDTLPDGTQLVGKNPITITYADGTVQTASSFPVTLKSTDAPVTVTYTTTAGSLTTDKTLENTATLQNGQLSYSGTGTISYDGEGQTGLKKTFVSSSETDGILYCTWDVNAYFDGYSSDTLVYKDVIPEDQTWHAGSAADIAADIEKSLQLYWMTGEHSSEEATWNSDSGMTFSLTFYDGSGNKVSANSNDVKSFALTIQGEDVKDIRYLTFSYQTEAAEDDMPSGQASDISNTGSIGTMTSNAGTTYQKPASLAKSVWDAKNSTWTTGSQVMDYKETDGILKYRLEIPITSDKSFDLTDVLNVEMMPSGISMNIVESNGDVIYQIGSEPLGDYVGFFPMETDHETKIYISVDSAPILDQTKGACTLVIEYQINIASDPYWDSILGHYQTYTNTLSKGSQTVSTSTGVERIQPTLSKSGVVISGQGTSNVMVSYTVLINPNGDKLLPDGQNLVVTDKLEPLDGVQGSLDLSSIQLYDYNAAAANGQGTELNSSEYSVTYDQKDNTLVLTVPDGKPLILIYEYTLKNNRAAEGALVNNVSGAGNSGSSSVSIEEASSSATINRFSLDIYKVKKDAVNVLLPNAHFELQQWHLFTGWKTMEDDLVTDENGHISLSGSNLGTDILYRLVETQAPDGYQIDADNNSYPFVILQEGQSEDDAKLDLVLEGINPELYNSADYISNSGGEIIISNEPMGLHIKKIWEDANGNTLPADKIPVDSIEAALYTSESPDGSDLTLVAGSQRTLNAANDWSGAWTDLPEQNSQGYKLYYFVKEETESSTWTTTYLDNDGDNAGDVSIINTMADFTSLPVTGGMGTVLLFAAGLVLVAAGLIVLKKKKGQ